MIEKLVVGRGRNGHWWGFGGGMVGFHIYSPPRGKRKVCHPDLNYSQFPIFGIMPINNLQDISYTPFSSDGSLLIFLLQILDLKNQLHFIFFVFSIFGILIFKVKGWFKFFASESNALAAYLLSPTLLFSQNNGKSIFLTF